MNIPNKFTFTVFDVTIFTATRLGEKYIIEWSDEGGVYNRTEYALSNVEQYLTPKPFDTRCDWTIKEILQPETYINIREALTTAIPSIDLQQAALAEIIRLDAIIAKLHDFTVERFLDGEAYNIPIKLIDEFSRDIVWASDEDSDERWDLLDGKYNKYKV